MKPPDCPESMRLCSTREAGDVDVDHFCPAPSQALWLAVLGIFSTEKNAHARLEIRDSWMAAAPPSMLPRFVLFGLGVPSHLREEATRHTDILFLRERSGASCTHEPLRKMLRWLSCATKAFPRAQLVGKADDDAFVHLPGIEMHLRASLAEAGVHRLYWGQMETFFWDSALHRPAKHSWPNWRLARNESCTHSSSLRGPFAFAKVRRTHTSSLPSARPPWSLTCTRVPPTPTLRPNSVASPPTTATQGPCYFLSSSLAADVVSSDEVWAEAEAALKPAKKGASHWPWEDVFLGGALAQLSSAAPAMALHVGGTVFSEHEGR